MFNYCTEKRTKMCIKNIYIKLKYLYAYKKKN